MVYSQEGIDFIGICTSYTSTKTQNPDSRVFCCISVQSSGFLVLVPERTPAKTRGFVVWECGDVLQYTRKTRRFTVYLQHRSKFTGICSTSYTSRKRDYRLSWLLAVLGFVSCHQHDVIFMMSCSCHHPGVIIMSSSSCHVHAIIMSSSSCRRHNVTFMASSIIMSSS